MNHSLVRLSAVSRAPFNTRSVSDWHDALRQRRAAQPNAALHLLDGIALMGLRGQMRLCETVPFVYLDRVMAPAAAPASPQVSAAIPASLPRPNNWHLGATVGAAASGVGAILVVVGQSVVSVVWLGITLSVGMMTAVYRSAWAGMFSASPAPLGALALLSAPTDRVDVAAPVPARSALRPALGAAAPSNRGRSRLFGPEGGHTRALIMNAPRLPRQLDFVPCAADRPAVAMASPQPYKGPELSPTVFAWPPAPSSMQMQLKLLNPLHDGVPRKGRWVAWPQLGLRTAGRLAQGFVGMDIRKFMQLRICAAEIATVLGPQPPLRLLGPAPAAAPRLTWSSDVELVEEYIRIPRTTPEAPISPASDPGQQGFAQSIFETVKGLWYRLGTECGLGAQRSLEAPPPRARRASHWPLLLQKAHSEPWSPSASAAWQAERRARGANDAFVRILRPTPSAQKTLTGPRLPRERLGEFLQRLREDGQLERAYAGGPTAFVDTVRALYADNMAREAAQTPPRLGPLGLHPQFIKDLPRNAFYVFEQGIDTHPAAAFEVNARLATRWDNTRTSAANIEACAEPLSAWLDKLCPTSRGLLRQDVTCEATQAGLAAACEAVQLHARPGALLSPTDQKSTEFVVWLDQADRRVHIAALVQYGKLMVMEANGDDAVQVPLYPYRMHVHLSVGERQDASMPKDVVIHEGDWSMTAPW